MKAMTEKQLQQREAALEKAGYYKSRATSSTNDYSWFKTIPDPQDQEEWLYMIEWRVWNWTKYIPQDPSLADRPYSMELCILVSLHDGNASRLVYPDNLSIPQAEALAKDLYELFTKISIIEH